MVRSSSSVAEVTKSGFGVAGVAGAIEVVGAIEVARVVEVVEVVGVVKRGLETRSVSGRGIELVIGSVLRRPSTLREGSLLSAREGEGRGVV